MKVTIMAKNTEKLVNVSGGVSQEVAQRIEDYRWPAHRTLSSVVGEAVTYFVDEVLHLPRIEVSAEDGADLPAENVLAEDAPAKPGK